MESRHYTLAHRIIHWLIAFIFLFLLLTVFLRQNWLNKDRIATMIQQGLSKSGRQLGAADAIKIGKSIRAPMWQWHVYAGYALLILYLLRIVLMKIQGTVFYSPFKTGISCKERTKSIIYVLFYLCFGLSLLTGLLLVWGSKDWPQVHKIAKLIHVQALYYAVTFVVLHIGGLVLAELGRDRGIISRMVHGK